MLLNHEFHGNAMAFATTLADGNYSVNNIQHGVRVTIGGVLNNRIVPTQQTVLVSGGVIHAYLS